MQYPRRVIKEGEKYAGVVIELKKRLNDALVLNDYPELKLDTEDPTFGAKMALAVKLCIDYTG